MDLRIRIKLKKDLKFPVEYGAVKDAVFTTLWVDYKNPPFGYWVKTKNKKRSFKVLFKECVPSKNKKPTKTGDTIS